MHLQLHKTHDNRPRESLLAQTVKNLPAIQEMWILSLGGEDPLEDEMATHSSILAWRILWSGYGLWSHKELDTTERLTQ